MTPVEPLVAKTGHCLELTAALDSTKAAKESLLHSVMMTAAAQRGTLRTGQTHSRPLVPLFYLHSSTLPTLIPLAVPRAVIILSLHFFFLNSHSGSPFSFFLASDPRVPPSHTAAPPGPRLQLAFRGGSVQRNKEKRPPAVVRRRPAVEGHRRKLFLRIQPLDSIRILNRGCLGDE